MEKQVKVFKTKKKNSSIVGCSKGDCRFSKKNDPTLSIFFKNIRKSTLFDITEKYKFYGKKKCSEKVLFFFSAKIFFLKNKK